MTYQILYCTKYGATKQISNWIEQRLKLAKKKTFISDIKSYKTKKCDTLILGTAIYGGKATKEFYDFLENDFEKFEFKNLNIFAVAMQKPACFDEEGKLRILQNYPHIKQKAKLQDVLLGEMIFENLSKKERDNLMLFYKKINLSKEKIEEKRSPRTLLNKKEVWDFAEKILGEKDG